MKPDGFSASSIHEIEREREQELAGLQMGGDDTGTKEHKTIKREGKNLGL